MKVLLKKWLKKLSPFPLSKNHHYDRLTEKIISRYCTIQSNCIDVGCYQAEILDIFIRYAPMGEHFAIEPIPALFKKLTAQYNNKNKIHLYNCAAGNNEGQTTFHHVLTNPSYSGLKKRKYDRKNERDETILVTIKKLDNIIPANVKIDFIKIDVEGGEYDVLLGALNIISSYHPLIIFEFGIGGSDVYGTTPEMMYRFFYDLHYNIFTLDSFCSNKAALTREELQLLFDRNKDYYFIAAPKN